MSAAPIRNLLHKRDFYGGALIVLLGVAFAVHGPSYGVGNLLHMGPGFMPTVLGIIMILLGIAIAVPAASPQGAEDEAIVAPAPQWWAWTCILASPIAFMLFGTYGGMIPGTFACVFVAGMGDRNMKVKNALWLSAIITVCGVGLFHYALAIPMALWQWGGG